MLQVFYGPDEFRRHEAIQAILARWNEEPAALPNTSWLDGTQIAVAELAAVCDSLPFLAPQRLVIVEGLLGRFDPGRQQERGQDSGPRRRANRDDEEQIAAWGVYLRSVPAHTQLILSDGALSSANPLLRAVRAEAEVREFALLKGAELERWVRERLARRGGSIEPAALRLLVDYVGPDLWTMAAEIEKLTTYADGAPIQEAMVRSLVASLRQASVFSLVDAVCERRPPQAMQELERLLHDGAAAGYLLAMLARQFRLLLLAYDLRRRGVAGQAMQGRLGISAYPFEKVQRQLRAFSWTQLKASHERILEADVALKTGQMDEEIALELLVADLCRIPAGRSAQGPARSTATPRSGMLPSRR